MKKLFIKKKNYEKEIEEIKKKRWKLEDLIPKESDIPEMKVKQYLHEMDYIVISNPRLRALLNHDLKKSYAITYECYAKPHCGTLFIFQSKDEPTRAEILNLAENIVCKEEENAKEECSTYQQVDFFSKKEYLLMYVSCCDIHQDNFIKKIEEKIKEH